MRNIAKQYGTSLGALHRHKAHVPATIAKAHEAREVARADNLLDQVRELTDEAREILRRVRAKDPRTALGAIREIRGNMDLLARLLGELHDQAAVTVNVLATPEWTAVQTRIARALAPYPEARAAVADALAGAPGDVVITNGRP
ncbi:MAG TPA: hypothetical protein VJT33_03490 [bacterium]|nr:hypothetical protein [bacterium]